MPDRNDSTLRACDEYDGRMIHFDDYVGHNEQVELYDDPANERGYRGPRIVYREPDTGEWWMRPLTEEESESRYARILERIGEL